MKDFFKDFFQHQRDKMKTPFFSALVFGLCFYYWEALYFLWSSNLEPELKIEFVKSVIDKKSILTPIAIVSFFLIVPLIFNWLIQLASDYLESLRSNQKNKSRIKSSNEELSIATNEALMAYEPSRIKQEHEQGIAKLRATHQELTQSLKQTKKISEEKESLYEKNKELIENLQSVITERDKTIVIAESALEKAHLKVEELSEKEAGLQEHILLLKQQISIMEFDSSNIDPNQFRFSEEFDPALLANGRVGISESTKEMNLRIAAEQSLQKKRENDVDNPTPQV